MSQIKEKRQTTKKVVINQKKEKTHNNVSTEKDMEQETCVEECVEEKSEKESKENSIVISDVTDINGDLNAYDNLLGAPCAWECLSEKYGWYLIKTVNHFEFYFNILTNKRCWKCPQELKEIMFQKKKEKRTNKEKEKEKTKIEGTKIKYELETDIEIYSDYSSNLGDCEKNGNEKILAILHSFKDMLIEKNIQKSDIYEDILPLIQYDIRFLSVPSVVRKQCFYLLLKKIHEAKMDKKGKNCIKNYPYSIFASIEGLKILLQQIETDARCHCNEKDIHLLLQNEKEYIGDDTESWKKIRELLIKEYVQKLIKEKKTIENGFNIVFNESKFLTNPAKYMYANANNGETTERYRLIYIEECVNLFKKKAVEILSITEKQRKRRMEEQRENGNKMVHKYAVDMGKCTEKEKIERKQSRIELEARLYEKNAFADMNIFSKENAEKNKKRKISELEEKKHEKEINKQNEEQEANHRQKRDEINEEKNTGEMRNISTMKQRNDMGTMETFVKQYKSNSNANAEDKDINKDTEMKKRKHNDQEKEKNREIEEDMRKIQNMPQRKKQNGELENYKHSKEYLIQNDMKEKRDMCAQENTRNIKLEPRDDTVMLYLLFENLNCPVINEVLLRSGNYEEKECFEKVFKLPDSITNSERYKRLRLSDNDKFQIYKHFIIGFTRTKLNIFKERIHLLPIEYINRSLNEILDHVDETGTEFSFLKYSYMHKSYVKWKRKRIKFIKEKFQEYLNDFDFSKYDLNITSSNEKLIEDMSLEKSYQLLKCVRHERDEMINRQIALFKKQNESRKTNFSESIKSSEDKGKEQTEENEKEEDKDKERETDIDKERQKDIDKEREKWRKKAKKKWKNKEKRKWKSKNMEKWKEYVKERGKWKNKQRSDSDKIIGKDNSKNIERDIDRSREED